MKRRFVAFLLLMSVLGGLCSCGRARAHRYTITDTFDTIIEVLVYSSAADAEKYGKMAETRLKEYHRLFDGYHPWAEGNNIHTLNESAGEWVEINDELSALLRFGLEAYEKTEGAVNLMGGAVTRLWKDTEVPPAEAELRAALRHISVEALELEQGRARITDPKARIDVGAFAKGYALQKVAEELKQAGFTGLISAVSSVASVGDKNGEPFVAGLSDARGGIARTVELSGGKSLSTSGTDQRFFTHEGKQYHHIIDLATGYPAESGLRQASVLHDDAGWADVLSTASLITGKSYVPDTFLFETEE